MATETDLVYLILLILFTLIVHLLLSFKSAFKGTRPPHSRKRAKI
jgi:hypothetical protein